MVMIFLLSSSSGCLGLLQSREAMENLRGEPDTQSETIILKHLKVFTNPTDWEVYENTTTFYIDETVSELTVWRRVKITGSDLIGCLENFTRYVRAELQAPNGQTVWAIDECVSVDPITDDISPDTSGFETGNWKLIINARGGGTQTGALQDFLAIDITIKRTCVQYPLEDACI